jgi:lipopolysaccharide transport system permease protein
MTSEVTVLGGITSLLLALALAAPWVPWFHTPTTEAATGRRSRDDMPDATVQVIGPRLGKSDYFRACWRQRTLLWYFARRDLVVRYRQTLLGVAWVLLRPALGMGVLGFLFGTLGNLPSHGLPYPLIVLVGMMGWQFVASVVGEGTGSIANSPSLITKVYFPRLLMPAAGLLLNGVDFAVLVIFVFVAMACYGVFPPTQAVLAPLAFPGLVATALGLACWTSALAVRFRDLRALVPVGLQYGLLVSPVAYLSSSLPAAWAWTAWVNPVSASIEWLRWCLLPGIPFPETGLLTTSSAVALVLLWSGLRYFRHAESRFADVL